MKKVGVKMIESIKNTINHYLKSHYQASDPVFQTELYQIFHHIKPVTIRQSLIRLSHEGHILKSDKIKGVYFLYNPNRILDIQTMNVRKYIEHKYLKDSNGEIIGYESGFIIANQLGLTSQVPSVSHIYSNAVAGKLREVRISNRKFIMNAPKVKVTTRNYKLLQVLDIIGKFHQYSEYSYEEANKIFKSYLHDLTLNNEEIHAVLSKYPIKTQLNFYKMEVDHVITSR